MATIQTQVHPMAGGKGRKFSKKRTRENPYGCEDELLIHSSAFTNGRMGSIPSNDTPKDVFVGHIRTHSITFSCKSDPNFSLSLDMSKVPYFTSLNDVDLPEEQSLPAGAVNGQMGQTGPLRTGEPLSPTVANQYVGYIHPESASIWISCPNTDETFWLHIDVTKLTACGEIMNIPLSESSQFLPVAPVRQMSDATKASKTISLVSPSYDPDEKKSDSLVSPSYDPDEEDDSPRSPSYDPDEEDDSPSSPSYKPTFS
jgi:hypothetical protein